MAPNNPELNPADYKISRFILQHEHKFWVNKTEKKQAAIGRSFGKQYYCIWVKICYFWDSAIYQVVQKHYLGEVEK